jgi:hypothetical protein
VPTLHPYLDSGTLIQATRIIRRCSPDGVQRNPGTIQSGRVGLYLLGAQPTSRSCLRTIRWAVPTLPTKPQTCFHSRVGLYLLGALPTLLDSGTLIQATRIIRRCSPDGVQRNPGTIQSGRVGLYLLRAQPTSRSCLRTIRWAVPTLPTKPQTCFHSRVGLYLLGALPTLHPYLVVIATDQYTIR